GSGQDRIVNGTGSGGANGELDTGTRIARDQLWLRQSGHALLVMLVGPTDGAIISNWYAGCSSAQLPKVVTSAGNVLDSQLSQLVQAMATYSSNNPGFDPTVATQAPNDSTLQAAIAAAWH